MHGILAHRSSSIGRCLKAVVALNTLPCDLQFLFISLSFQLQARREGLSIAGRFWVRYFRISWMQEWPSSQVKVRFWSHSPKDDWILHPLLYSCCYCCCWWWWWWWWRATKRIWWVECKMPIHHQKRAQAARFHFCHLVLGFFIRYFFRRSGASQAWEYVILPGFFARNPVTTPFLAVGCPGAPNKWTSTWRWLADVKSISLLWAMDQWKECHFCRPFLSIADRLDLKDCSQKWWLVDVSGAYVKRHWVFSESMERKESSNFFQPIQSWELQSN